ncbi:MULTISPECIES: hypothetical protein [unclassified Streptomyces]|uniref:hypothetical protein n=1 Tax=unclassified Streptomyces TaxID=2593676 RepID=UPI00036CF8AB|nr:MULTISPECIES: hypothetical protein [unclassified Streptomyces]MYT30065.1 hypothetical protein [Streptomyces sp. SID8354]
MRRVLAGLLGAFALAGIVSVPAHASGFDLSGTGVIGAPLTVVSDIGPLHVGRLPLFGGR